LQKISVIKEVDYGSLLILRFTFPTYRLHAVIYGLWLNSFMKCQQTHYKHRCYTQMM